MLKPLKQLRQELAPHSKPINTSSTLKYLAKLNIDFDVYLPTKRKCLQRDFIWTLAQKRELINSILIDRHIPKCTIISIVNQANTKEDILQVIDGKQRLSTMLDFYNNHFQIQLFGDLFHFKELPEDYKSSIERYCLNYDVLHEEWNKPITDDEKIKLFKFINFAGTPQDIEHLKELI